MSEGNYRAEDHRRQMRNEKPEAICDRSGTERHVFQMAYDKHGRPNYKSGQIVNCEACGRFIKQDGARWVVAPDEEWVKAFMKLPALIIQEQDTIDDLL